ncbi:hypothetical protein B9Z19DRAFT_150357 [Tuber borchii]|uniref:Uncharacterized protein n=1 Tax=Tuber borchii TaxID=42251 RepID=A0A2T6ZQ19_TUBBO|nr:hypothetical protein B9Z19DRAFT_150357 [Tuber borchii]
MMVPFAGSRPGKGSDRLVGRKWLSDQTKRQQKPSPVNIGAVFNGTVTNSSVPITQTTGSQPPQADTIMRTTRSRSPFTMPITRWLPTTNGCLLAVAPSKISSLKLVKRWTPQHLPTLFPNRSCSMCQIL